MNQKKVLFLILAFLMKGCTIFAQGSFIKKLPMRGVPAKMIATSDGGYACLAATNYENFQFNKISLIKCDANGDTIWTQKYRLNDTSVYFPEDVVEIAGVGFAIVSRFNFYPIATYHNGVVFFTDLTGNEIWNKIFFDSSSSATLNYYTNLLQLSGNLFSVLGGLYPYKYLNTLDYAGNLLNINTIDTFSYGFSNLNLDTAETPVLSRAMPPNVYNRQNIFKCDASYNHLIDKNYTQVKGQFASFNKLDNGLAYLSLGGDTIIKLNSNLDSLWTNAVTNYYAPGFTTQLPTDFKATADGGYVMCGNISNAIAHLVFLLKTDSLSNSIFRQIYFGALVDNVVSVEEATDGGFVMFQSGNPDSTNIPEMWLVKTDSTGVLTNVNTVVNKPALTKFTVSPNPANSQATLTFNKTVSGQLNIYSVDGAMLKKFNLNQKSRHQLMLNNFKSGMYFIKFTPQKDLPYIQKLIINH